MGRVLIPIAAVALTVAGVAGCGSDSTMMSRNETPMVQTTPADGADGFDPAAPIYMKFSEVVDTGKFHDSFFCMEDSSHQALHDSLAGSMMGGGMGDHGSMGGMMGDTSKAACDRMHSGMMGGNHGGPGDSAIYGRMHGRRIPGQVSWNATGDSCVFTPSDGLMHNRDYVMMFRSDMRTRSGGRMRNHGGRFTQDVMIHFRTR